MLDSGPGEFSSATAEPGVPRASSVASPGKRPLIDPVALAVVLGLGSVSLLACFLSGGDVVATLGLMIAAAMLALIWVIPLRWTITSLLVLGVTLEAPYEQFAEYLWRTPWEIAGTLLLGNLNLVTHVAAMKIDGAALVLIYLVVILWVRRARGDDIDTRGTVPLAPPLVTAVGISMASIVILWVWGIGTGGGVPESLLQVQKLIYAVLLLFLMHGAYRGAKDLRTLGTVLIGSAIYRALLATYVHFTVKWHGEFLPCATTHADSRLFAAALVMLVIMINERARHATHWTRLLAAGLIMMGMVFNGRRLVWVAVAGGLIIAAMLSPRTLLKRRLSRATLAMMPVVLLYVAVGWNHAETTLFKPVRMIRSVVDSKSDGSSMWRDLENMNMVMNIRDHPLTGIGYGHEYTEYFKLPDVSAAFPRYRIIPHNGLLVLFPFCGPFGVAGVFAMLLTTVFLSSRAYRATKDPAIRSAALMSIVLVYLHFNQTYGDIGVADWLTTFTLGPAMMLAGKLSVETGGWPWRVAKPLPKKLPRREFVVEDVTGAPAFGAGDFSGGQR